MNGGCGADLQMGGAAAARPTSLTITIRNCREEGETMVALAEDGIGAIGHIFHPTDFSPPSMAAFGHALKLAVDLKA